MIVDVHFYHEEVFTSKRTKMGTLSKENIIERVTTDCFYKELNVPVNITFSELKNLLDKEFIDFSSKYPLTDRCTMCVDYIRLVDEEENEAKLDSLIDALYEITHACDIDNINAALEGHSLEDVLTLLELYRNNKFSGSWHLIYGLVDFVTSKIGS